MIALADAVLVDSDILIEVARGRNASVTSRWSELSRSATIFYSPVSVAELWAGVRDGESAGIANLFAGLTCIGINAEVGRLAGNYMRQYRKSHSVELADALIAATAVAGRAQLWTCNRKHYPMKDIVFLAG